MRVRAIISLVFVVAACGAEPGPAATPVTTPGLPVTYVGADGVSTTVTDLARIVSFSGDYSEIIFALGLGDNLVGVDLSSVFPPDEMRAKPKIGVEFRLLAEPILVLDPTLAIGDLDASPSTAVEQVRGAGVPVVILPRYEGLDAPGRKIRAVAGVLGLAEEGEALAEQVEAEIAAALALAETTTSRPRVAVVYVASSDTVLLLAGNTVFTGVLDALGAIDVGPDAGVDGFVPLTAEAIVAAAPDVIITAQRGFEGLDGLEGFLALPGLAQTPAGQAGRVLVYEDLYLLGMGPRTGQLAEDLVRDLHPELGG
ncbi:MAG: ABC transporter substrate-binding protein [Acidimicrobiia bacterium]|nr:ABC transporter substrate-binding protein [Acidimicrobiia bacterium]